MSRWTQFMRKHPRTKRLPVTDLKCEAYASSRGSVYMYHGKDKEKAAAMKERARCKNNARWRYIFLKARNPYDYHNGETIYVCSSHLLSYCIYSDTRELNASDAWMTRQAAKGVRFDEDLKLINPEQDLWR